MEGLNSQTQLLVNFIRDKKGEVKFETVQRRAYDINPLWRESTWTCSLRHRKDIERLYEATDSKNSVVTGYLYIGNKSNICQENTSQEGKELTGIEFERQAMKQSLEEQKEERVEQPSQSMLKI